MHKKTCNDKILVLLGPTASGKTKISLLMAQRMGLEIVSVDSMQVYRGMDIGTAKVSKELRQSVPHHMIDIAEPDETFNAARFSAAAIDVIADIAARGRKPLLVCGTPFYLKALLWGMFDGPGAQPEIRHRLRTEAAEVGVNALHERLSKIDPKAADKINPNDYKRIERALEVYAVMGGPISERQETFNGPPRIDAKIIGLHWPRHIIHERIDERVENMLDNALVEEVKAIRHRLGPQARQAVGYKEIISYLDGEIGFEDAVELVKRNTRRLAKDQIGWFKKFPVENWVELHRRDSIWDAAKECINLFF